MTDADTPDSPPPGDPFATAWDNYAAKAQRAGARWPGDDWGTEEVWDNWFARLFAPFGVATWERAVEIGQGTGKYTKRVLDAGPATVLACDVSRHFIDLCAERMHDALASGRLVLEHISSVNPDSLRDAAEKHGWIGQADALFSIDALVHVPFTQVTSYLLQASEILRPGGKFIMSFANGTSEPGLHKMVQDVRRVVRDGGHPKTGCFHWVSPELVQSTAAAMGYSIDICDTDPLHGRDGHFVATLADPDRARVARDFAAEA